MSNFRLLIGPTNCAEQNFRWANATRDLFNTVSCGDSNSLWGQNLHQRNLLREFALGNRGTKSQRSIVERNRQWIINNFTHVLIDFFNPIVNYLDLQDVREDIKYLNSNGLKVGMIAHGSDLRSPSLHKELEPLSPHHNMEDEENRHLESVANSFRNYISSTSIELYISVLDLVPHTPRYKWLPVIAQQKYFDIPISKSRKIPLICHIPSDPKMKGTSSIEKVLLKLHEKGFIQYLRPNKISALEVYKLISRSDIIIDTMSGGFYGVLGTEALASGKIVLGQISDEIRNVHSEAIPIVNITPLTLEDTILDVVVNSKKYDFLPEESKNYAAKWHSGAFSKKVITDFVVAKTDESL